MEVVVWTLILRNESLDPYFWERRNNQSEDYLYRFQKDIKHINIIMKNNFLIFIWLFLNFFLF